MRLAHAIRNCIYVRMYIVRTYNHTYAAHDSICVSIIFEQKLNDEAI